LNFKHWNKIALTTKVAEIGVQDSIKGAATHKERGFSTQYRGRRGKKEKKDFCKSITNTL
jgi:hypothetical protein